MNWFLYDFFDHTHDQQYWRGEATPMPPPAARDVLKIINNRFGGLKPNTWSPSDYIGGLTVAGDMAAVFRIYNGGRDHAGRPHRWVLLMAAGTVSEVTGLDVIKAVESPVLSAYGVVPVPSPASFPAAAPNFSEARSHVASTPVESFDGTGPEAEEKARRASRQLTQAPGEGWLLVQRSGAQFQAWCQCAILKAVVMKPTVASTPSLAVSSLVNPQQEEGSPFAPQNPTVHAASSPKRGDTSRLACAWFLFGILSGAGATVLVSRMLSHSMGMASTGLVVAGAIGFVLAGFGLARVSSSPAKTEKHR